MEIMKAIMNLLKKKLYYFIFAAILLVIYIVIFTILVTTKNNSQKGQKNNSNQNNSQQTQQNQSLAVANTYPSDKQIDVPTSSIIKITFNQPVTQQISVNIQPNISFSTEISSNLYILHFPSDLSANTEYTFTVKYNGQALGSYSFKTAETPVISPIDNAAQNINEWTKTNQPDMFLYRNTPYEAPSFSVAASFAQNGTAEFVVTINSQNPNQGKKDFIAWVKSLGLTDSQIQNLTIHYSSPAGGP